MDNQQEEQELSHEELMARKEEMKKFYDESVPYLESQAKYEKLLTDIEEARFKRVSYQYQFARMVGDGPEDEGKPEAPDRKLKKK
ncbi:MAG: hypothetical protein NTY55_03035 [Flavobacteriia bacterium]|jgi:hypothetical protein|nr:hypothetical protein [Flavobacteriia bacterium]